MEADEEALAGPRRRGPQVPGWSEHVLLQIGIRRWIGVHVEVHDLFAFGDKHVAHRAGQFDRLGGTQFLFARVNLFENRGVSVRQELLCALAGDSARAVEIPVNLRRLLLWLRHDYGFPFLARC
jgi:hypothetical protein